MRDKRRNKLNSNTQGMNAFLATLNRTTLKDLRSTSKYWREKIPKEKVQIKIKKKLSNNNVVKMLSTAHALPINEKHNYLHLIGRMSLFKNVKNVNEFNKKQWVVFHAIFIFSDGFHKNYHILKKFVNFIWKITKNLTTNEKIAFKTRLLKFDTTIDQLKAKKEKTLVHVKELFEILSAKDLENFYFFRHGYKWNT